MKVDCINRAAIKRKMKQKGFTYRTLSEKAREFDGVTLSHPTVGAFLNGKDVLMSSYFAICAALEASPKTFIKKSEER